MYIYNIYMCVCVCVCVCVFIYIYTELRDGSAEIDRAVSEIFV
jgi:hypothetical protein